MSGREISRGLLLAAAVLMGLVVVVAGCGLLKSEQPPDNTGKADQAQVTADCDVVVQMSADSTKTASFTQGDRVALLVDTNGTIPYADVLMEKPDALTFVEMRSINPNQGKPIAGAGYTAVWVFDATAAGEGLLRIQKWPLAYIDYDESTGLWHLKDPNAAQPDERLQTWNLQVSVR